MKKYSVTLIGYRTNRYRKTRRQDGQMGLTYMVEANNALLAADHVKEMASQHYPEYKEFEVYDVTEEK